MYTHTTQHICTLILHNTYVHSYISALRDTQVFIHIIHVLSGKHHIIHVLSDTHLAKAPTTTVIHVLSDKHHIIHVLSGEHHIIHVLSGEHHIIHVLSDTHLY